MNPQQDASSSDSSAPVSPTTAAAQGQAPPVVPNNTTRIRPLNFTITVPNLRNGAVQSIQHAAPKSSMSSLYHWPIISGMQPADAVGAVEYLIRACYTQLCHITGGQLTPAQEAEFRKKAIILGAIRAGAAGAYNLTRQDMTERELTTAGMTMVGDAIGQSAQGTTSAGRWTMAQSMPALSNLEVEVIGVLVYIGMAVPVLQGVSLVMSGHHYIPPTYNLFKGIKRQALGGCSSEARGWVDGMGESFDDMAFHKACHPISPTLKRSLSKSSEIAQRLKASGHGAAAIRLPAIPSEASGGKAAIALARSAAATMHQMQHTIDVSVGTRLMADLEKASEGQAEADACDAVVNWIANSADKLAFCAGIVSHVHESTGTGTNTILAAYSVRRIMADNPAAVARGQVYARAAANLLRKQLEDNMFPDPQIRI
jgi:hypothetical protein